MVPDEASVSFALFDRARRLIPGGGFPIGGVAGAAAMSAFDILAGPYVSRNVAVTANPVSLAAGVAALASLSPARAPSLSAAADQRSG